MAPTSAASSTLNTTTQTTPTTNGLTSLRSVSDLLHLSFHRNKNQHRLAKWWSSFSQLRRQVQKLVKQLEALETAEKYAVPKKGKKSKGEVSVNGKEGVEGKYVVAAKEKVRERVDFMERWLAPGCYVAFTNLIADNQYAPLGLVLMATLARTKRVIRPFGSEILSPPTLPPLPSNSSSQNSTQNSVVLNEAPEYDLGEIVSRSQLSPNVEVGDPVLRTSSKDDVDEAIVTEEKGEVVMISGIDGDEDEDEEIKVQVKKIKKKRKEMMIEEMEEVSVVTTMPTTKKPKKKKRKGGDAFDDLFSSLM